MTHLEAIAAMRSGKKVRHTAFADHEFFEMIDGVIYCQNGNTHSLNCVQLSGVAFFGKNWSIF